MLGKAERPLRTLIDNASALLHNMSVPNSMWSCAMSTVVYLRNRTFSRAVGVSGVSLGIDDIIRTISTHFAVFSEIPNAKFT
jgi:hypothetical protein